MEISMYNVELDYPDLNYTLVITPEKDDFIIYLWEQTMKVKFNPYLYRSDDEDGKVYKKLEDDWLHNKIDQYKLTHSPDFKKFLTERYRKQAYDSCWQEQKKLANMCQVLYED